MKRLTTVTVLSVSLAALFAGAASVAQQSTNGAQSYGWTVETPPVDPDQIDRPLTELERLSQSASGMRLGSQFYDSRSDNPLDPVSVTLRALDKITAQYTDITIDIDDTVEFGSLQITARTCDQRPPEEFPETTAFLEITSLEPVEADIQLLDADPAETVEEEGADLQSSPEDEETSLTEEAASVTSFEDGLEAASEEFVFSGWMFASSPALNALEHAVYDVWVIDCKMVDPSAG